MYIVGLFTVALPLCHTEELHTEHGIYVKHELFLGGNFWDDEKRWRSTDFETEPASVSKKGSVLNGR